MTEAEKIRYAKLFVDKMANGIDPLTDQPIPEGDMIYQVRISRCLFYVSDLLRQLAEQKEAPAAKSEKGARKPFALDHDRRRSFPFSDIPIPVSEIVKRLNALTETEDMKKLTHHHVTRWLLDVGVLEEITDINGKKTRRPTRKGEELGIRTEDRRSENGEYTLILYDRSAQQFLLDNLDGVTELAAQKRERTSTREMQGKPWTRPQEEFLVDRFQKRVPIGEIAAALKRSEGAVRLRLERLGLLEPGADIR